MNKKQRAKREKSRRHGTSRAAGTGQPGSRYSYASYENPVAGMTRVERNELGLEIGQHHAGVFDKSFARLRELASGVELTTVLSTFAAYGLTSSDGQSREWLEEDPILQHHVELLQAVFLMDDGSGAKDGLMLSTLILVGSL